MRKRGITVGLVVLVAAVATTLIAVAMAATGVKTAKPPYLLPTAPGVVVDPILSTGDIVPQGQTPAYQMSGIPDGLGAYIRKDRSAYNVLMNHELGRTFPNQPAGVDTRISKLTIDRKTNSVLEAKYVFTGNEGFERFCSAHLEVINGTPYYFTGEEAVGAGHDGSSIVMNAETGEWQETAHFGHIQHENVIPAKLSDWFFLTTDDDFRPGFDAYLYAYIAKSFEGAVSGTEGSLYVWKADNAVDSTQALKGVPLTGRFVPITQAENANSVTIKAAAAAKGAFKFDRLEDAAKSWTKNGRFYFADTGKAPRTARGRIYLLQSVARVATPATLRPGTWESSGVFNAFGILGAGWWLTDVQAHNSTSPQPGPTLVPNSGVGEDGQLQAVYIPQTIGGEGDD